MSDNSSRPATPRWYWLVAGLGFLWNCGGAFDYVMTKTENEAYLSNIEPEALAYYMALPSWLTIFYALAVWGGLVGWILMLLRSRFAVPVFITSLLAMIVNFGYIAATGGFKLLGTGGSIFTCIILVIGILTIWYARKMRARGILK